MRSWFFGAAAPRRLRVLAALIATAGFLVSARTKAQDEVPQGRIVPEQEEIQHDLARARLRLGPLRLIPSIDITNAGYDNNVYASSTDPVSDWTATVTAGFRFILPVGSKMYLRADALPTYTWYDKLTERRFFGGYYNGTLFGFFNRLSLALTAAGDQTYRNYSTEFDSAVVHKNSTIGGSLEVNVAGPLYVFGEGGYARIRYDETGTVPPDGIPPPPDVQPVIQNDRNQTSYTAGVRYRHGHDFSTSLAYSETRSDYLNQEAFRDNLSRAALMGLFISHQNLFLNLTGGWREGVPDGSLYPSYSTGVGAFFVSWFPLHFLEIRGGGRRRVVNSLSATNPYYFENRLSGSAAVEMLGRFLLRGYYEQGPNNYPVPQQGDNGDLIRRRDDARLYGGGLSVKVIRNVVATGSVTRHVYDSNIPSLSRDYTRFTAFLSFNGEYVR
jgi:hypothetical protein